MPTKGSYRKQGENSWEIRLSFGKNPIINKYDRYRETFYGTEKQCQERINELNYEYRHGSKPQSNTFTVAEYLNYWYEKYVKEELKPTTQRWYKMLMDKHIIPFIGKYKLADIGPLHIENFYNQRRQEVGNYNIRDIHTCLSSAFNRAFMWRMKNDKFMDQVEPIPRKERQKLKKSGNQKIVWTPEEAFGFLRFAKLYAGRRYYLYLIALTTGLRRGENLGLMWKYIDFENQIITVAGQVTENGYEDYVKDNEERYIYLFDYLKEELEVYKELQDKEKDLAKELYNNNDWLHSQPNGKLLMCCHNVTHRFQDDIVAFNALREEKNIRPVPVISLHRLRNTYASLLYECFGVHKELIADILGHYDPDFSDSYIHKTIKGQKEYLNRFGDFLKNPPQN